MGEMAHKITLSSGKIVLIRDMKIKYQNLALRAVGNKAGDNQSLLGSLMQQELLKILLVEIDGKPIDAKKLEALDDMFSYQEFIQMGQVMGEVMGGGKLGEFQTEIVAIGGK